MDWYETTVDKLIPAIFNRHSSDTILFVNHNPGISQLLYYILNNQPGQPMQMFEPASLAILQVDVARWTDFKPGNARLTHFAHVHQLNQPIA